MKTDLFNIYEPDFQQYGERAIVVDNDECDIFHAICRHAHCSIIIL